MVALTGEELLRWVNTTTDGWRKLAGAHPELLTLPCDIYGAQTVAGLLQHIVAVELRYAERLLDRPETAYADVPFGSADAIFATHDRASELFRALLSRDDYEWEQTFQFQTRRAGMLESTRRTVLLHTLFHSIRHYAQLATLARQHGIPPDWSMDYMMMNARPIDSSAV